MRQAKHVINEVQSSKHSRPPSQAFKASGGHLRDGVGNEPGRQAVGDVMCFMLGEMEFASQVRIPSNVMTTNPAPLTNTVPSRCSRPIPIVARPKAMNAFSPM